MTIQNFSQHAISVVLLGMFSDTALNNSAKREKFDMFSHRREEINSRGRNNGKLKMSRTSSCGRPYSTRDPLSKPQEWNIQDRRPGQSGRLDQKNEKHPERGEKNQPKLREECQVKKTKQLADI